jgi:hypothetical protein
MTSGRTNQGRIGTVASGWGLCLGQAAVLVALILLGSLLIARGAAGSPLLPPGFVAGTR